MAHPFKPGDKIKCEHAGDNPLLEKGKIYIVCGIEVEHVYLEGKEEWGGFFACRFVLADEAEKGCTCTIQVLMTGGCKCGAFQKEQKHGASV